MDRDGSLILTAPEDCPEATIEETARKKQLWVHTKLAEKRLLFRPRAQKEYVTGEGFQYLGRSYRLLLVVAEDDSPTPALRLRGGWFELRRDERHRAEGHFVGWYTRNGEPWIRRRVSLLSDRIGGSQPLCPSGNSGTAGARVAQEGISTSTGAPCASRPAWWSSWSSTN
jgi:hypothetical protein